MDEILNQLGGLILGSVPTILFFLALVVAYGLLVRRPLDAVLAERRARTSGAIEQAKEALGAAEAETAVFEDKLRAARMEIFQAREARLKQWNAEREASLKKTREAMEQRTSSARETIQQSTLDATRQIDAMATELGTQVLRAILPAGTQGMEASR